MAVHSEVTARTEAHQVRHLIVAGIAIDMMNLGGKSAPQGQVEMAITVSRWQTFEIATIAVIP